MSAQTPPVPQGEPPADAAGLNTQSTAVPQAPVPVAPSLDLPAGQAGTQTSASPAIVQQNNLPASPSNNRPGYRFTSVELTEEEFHTPGVHKVMFQDMLRLEGEVNDLKEFRQKYAAECTVSAVLGEQLKAAQLVDTVKQNARSIADIFLAVAMLTAGFFLSHADNLTDTAQAFKFWLFAVAACVLAIVVKVKAK